MQNLVGVIHPQSALQHQPMELNSVVQSFIGDGGNALELSGMINNYRSGNAEQMNQILKIYLRHDISDKHNNWHDKLA